ncbi:divergent polysaccharide deacetylase family protein [Desulfococcaceae bacterium HSG7]|nr:divergent polysaccharide deacetylase family protein [Desulfococcaceae bacterium HSG9]MDM8553265.1 divergent polysaccharide deacetylase family protein [Desulfococcaceae bacterium HSG7]
MDRRAFIIKSAAFLTGNFAVSRQFIKTAGAAIPPPKIKRRPCVAIIIDDIGYSRKRAWQFLKIGIPLTFSILPQLTYSCELASAIHDHGHEIMLHQPMEPYNMKNHNPGPAAIYTRHGRKQIQNTMALNIRSTPFVVGVNNHMGSRFTEQQDKIRPALEVVRSNDLFFIDSRTSGRSIAYKTALAMQMTTLPRHFFLDNTTLQPVISAQLNKLKRRALKYGYAIGIGHPFPWTVKAIARFASNLNPSQIKLTYISEVLKIAKSV